MAGAGVAIIGGGSKGIFRTYSARAECPGAYGTLLWTGGASGSSRYGLLRWGDLEVGTNLPENPPLGNERQRLGLTSRKRRSLSQTGRPLGESILGAPGGPRTSGEARGARMAAARGRRSWTDPR